MLSIGVIGGWGGDGRSAGYYTASVARGRDDYYTGKGEAPGEWFGAGAQTLGLAGEIDADEFHKVVMEAVDPTSGEQLRRLARDHPVHGVDMTFSAPRLLRTPTSDRCQALTLRWASRGVGCSHAVGRCVCKIASSVHGLTLTDGHRARADRQSGSSCCGRIAVRLLLRPSRSVPGSHGSSASSDPPRNRGPCGADSTARAHGVRGGDEAGAPPVPPGLQQVKTDDFSVAVPDGWQVATRKVEGTSDEFTEVRPEGTDANRGELRIGSSREYDGDINAASLLHSAEISTRRSGAQKTLSEAIEVPGGADALRIEFTAPASAPLAAGRIVTVLALRGSHARQLEHRPRRGRSHSLADLRNHRLSQAQQLIGHAHHGRCSVPTPTAAELLLSFKLGSRSPNLASCGPVVAL